MKNKFRTPGETHEEREKFWADLIAEARDYPGGIAKFCRDRQIGKEVYYHWFRLVKNRFNDWQTPLQTNQKRRKNAPKKKSNRNSTPPRTRKEWAHLVELCNSSGATPSAFARNHNLNKVTFCRWYKRLFRNEALELISEREQPATVDFVPVNVIDKPSQVIDSDENLLDVVEIVLANKRMIRVRPGCTPDFLKTVISVMEAY